GPVPQQPPQVELFDGKEAVADLAVRGEADAVALAAEGTADGGNDAELAPVGEHVLPGRIAGVVALGKERPHLPGPGQQLVHGYHQVPAPGAVAVEGHELDEAHLKAPLPAPPEKGGNFV